MTDAIQEWIERVAMVPISGDEETPDICVIEVKKMRKKFHFKIISTIISKYSLEEQ